MTLTSGAIMVERAFFAIKCNHPYKDIYAREAITYLQKIEFTDSPHWDTLKITSGWQNTEKIVKTALNPRQRMEQLLVMQNFREVHQMLISQTISESRQYRHLSDLIQVLLLDGNYSAVQEMAYLTKNRIAPPSNEDKTEYESYLDILLISSTSLYFQDRCFDFCEEFCNIMDQHPLLVDYLRERSHIGFLQTNELLLMFTISTLVSIPLNKHKTFYEVESIQRLVQLAPYLKSCLELLINTRFKSFSDLWNNEINELNTKSLFLSNMWPLMQSEMRENIYLIYLSMINQVEIKYLADIVRIPCDIAKEELTKLIDKYMLNFSVNSDIVVYREKSITEHLVEKLKVNEQHVDQLLKAKMESSESIKES